MKKKAYTLAEVLITLGIVGVVAALLLPNLIQDISTSQVIPKLNKVTAMFEQANTALLSTNKVDSLTDSGFLRSKESYAEELKKYLRMSKTSYGYLLKDGMSYDFTIEKRITSDFNPAHRQVIGLMAVDINGKSKPNEVGTDIFYYDIFNDGGLSKTDRTEANVEEFVESEIKNETLPDAVPSTKEEIKIVLPTPKPSSSTSSSSKASTSSTSSSSKSSSSSSASSSASSSSKSSMPSSSPSKASSPSKSSSSDKSISM